MTISRVKTLRRPGSRKKPMQILREKQCPSKSFIKLSNGSDEHGVPGIVGNKG